MKLEQIQQAIPAPVNTGLNVGAIGTTVATVAGWLPAIAALVSIVWLSLQIWVFFIKKPWKKKE